METVPIPEERHGELGAVLQRCPLFRALKPEHFPQVIRLAEQVHFHPEETIIRQGEPSGAFFLLIEGEAAITVDRGGEPLEIGRMGPPSSLGEMGLLLGEARTASVVAVTEAKVLRFGAKAFEAMFQKIPDFGLGLARGLASRLNQVSGKVQLPEYDVARMGRPSAEVVSMLPFEMIQRHRVLPLKVEGNVLILGLVDDPTPEATAAVRAILPSMDLRPVHIDAKCFSDVLRVVGGESFRGTPAAPVEVAPALRSPRLDPMLERMVAEGASDVHLSAGCQPRWRVDGEMRTIADTAVLGPNDVLELVLPVMEDRHKRAMADNDVDLAYAIPGVARFRVNVFRDNNGVSAVFRQIPSKILTFEQLQLPPVVRSFCELPKGLVLVTGPTGSGKSTTLAAMIDHINKTRAEHIITMEDPIEFVHPSQKCLVNQREVGAHTVTFARALKAALREDPDIVLVGEMRDLETISLALETANTGHLVFGTLHTNTAISTVDRVVDQFPADQQDQVRTVLADVLKGVVSQMLLKKKGGGRVAALEVLVVTYAIANLIREGKTVQVPGMMQTSKGQGMQLLNDVLYEMIEERKIVEMAEAMSKSPDKEDLARRFRAGLYIAGDPPDFSRFRVVNVAPETPAAAAGLSRGDYIVEIAGKPASTYTLDEAKALFRTDAKHNLTVERQGKRRPVVLDLKK